jgi:sulfotransferase family protein
VRIVIAGPPKTGNMWLKCLLGRAYGLRWLRSFETPVSADFPSLRAWLADGRFPDGTIFHQHYDFAPEIADALEAVPARLVTIVRDPYDAFVSTYYTLQQHAAEKNQKGRKFTELMGKSLDDPAVVEFLRRGGYSNNLQKARDWAGSGRAVVLRYEDLSRDPLAALRHATAQIAPVSDDSLQTAIDYCRADRMRQRTKGGSKHVRAATVGDSVRQLTQEHLDAFRETYGDIISELDYPVR